MVLPIQKPRSLDRKGFPETPKPQALHCNREVGIITHRVPYDVYTV